MTVEIFSAQKAGRHSTDKGSGLLDLSAGKHQKDTAFYESYEATASTIQSAQLDQVLLWNTFS